MLAITVLLILATAMIGALLNVAMGVLARSAPPAAAMAAAAAWPPVTVLKPLHGDEPLLAPKVASVFAQDYPAPVQVIFGARNCDDPGLATARRVSALHPHADTRFIADATRHGTNNKLSNLINMDALARHPVVVIADSDVAWAPDTLRRLVVAIEAPGTGLVSPLHIGRGDAGFWSRLAAMDISYRFMPSVLLGIAIGLARPVLGPTMALRRTTLDAIGGFAAFRDVLADDYELGRAVRATGASTAVVPCYVIHGCSEGSLAALVRHELRWTVTIYLIDRPGLVGSVLVHTVPLALIGACLAGFSPLALGALGAALASRAFVKWRIDRATGEVSGPLALVPLRDLLSFALFFATFFVHKVDWRGSEFRVTRDGRLQSR